MATQVSKQEGRKNATLEDELIAMRRLRETIEKSFECVKDEEFFRRTASLLGKTAEVEVRLPRGGLAIRSAHSRISKASRRGRSTAGNDPASLSISAG